MIKGYLDKEGKPQEKIFEVIWAGNRTIYTSGKLPEIGATVDIPNAAFTNDIGAVSFQTIWTDPDSFMFLKPTDESSEENILLSIFSVIAASLELWRIAIDNGFSIRGGIDFGDIQNPNSLNTSAIKSGRSVIKPSAPSSISFFISSLSLIVQ